MLARIARFDPELLYPISHRSKQAQTDLELLKARDMLVKTRTSLINHVRGAVKSFGERLPKCSAESFHKQCRDFLPENLKTVLQVIIETIEHITDRIKEFGRKIEKISREVYPETELLKAIGGVGPLTALAYVLVLEEPGRFGKGRQVGKFLGLTPRRDQSGETDKQLRITKAGNRFLRRLLVGAAQYILGPFGPDCHLRRFGLRLAERGGKSAKKRAVVAVARKLAVLMHRLWCNGGGLRSFLQVSDDKECSIDKTHTETKEPCKERPVWKTASLKLGQSSANDIIKTDHEVAASNDGP
jgi:transposase